MDGDRVKNSQPTLQWVIQSSTRLRHYLILIHVLALVACLANALAMLYKMLLLGVVIMHFRFSWRKYINSRHLAIRHSDVAGWEVLLGHRYEPIKVLGSTVTTTFAIFLHFTGHNNARHNAIILNDALFADDYRQLLVRLKTAGVN